MWKKEKTGHALPVCTLNALLEGPGGVDSKCINTEIMLPSGKCI